MIIRFGKYKTYDISKISFLDFFLPIYSILIYYTLPVVGSVGQVILFAYTLVFLLLHRYTIIKAPKWLLLFALFTIPVQVIVFHTIGGFNSSRFVNLLMIIVYVILLGLFKVDIDGLMIMYKVVATIASILIIVQFIQIYFGGQVVHQIMLFSFERPEVWYKEGLRPQGLFPEPQVYATFIIPILILCLKKNEYKWAIFLTLSIFLSTSTLGIICSLIVWVFYLFNSSIEAIKKIAIIGIILVVAIGFVTLPIFDYAVQKLVTTDFTNNVRLTRGFTIYQRLPWENKLFGIGVNNLEYYINSGMIVLNDYMSRAMRNSAYITTVSELLINYGLISTVIYVGFIINLLKNSEVKLLVVLLVILSFGQTILFSGVWFLFVIIIISTLREDNNTFLKFSKKEHLV